MMEKVIHNGIIIAIIIRASYEQDGITFFTPEDFSQQLAYMKREKNYKIAPHIHNHLKRSVFFTQETLFIKSGRVKIDLYDNHKKYLESKILEKGDVILLASGGHGLEMLEQTEMIEVKQGPYLGEQDKSHF